MNDERPAPASLEAERMLLGQMMRDPDDVLVVVRDLALKPAHFYSPANAALFGLMLRMADAGEAIDPTVTVPDRVMQGGHSERYGGLEYVVELPDRVPATANAQVYAQLILDKAARRSLLETLDKAREAAYALDTAAEAIEQVAGAIGEIRRPGRQRGVWLATATSQVLDENDKIAKSPESQYLRSPWPEVNSVLRVSGGDLVIVAARPGMGKSAFVLNWLLGNAVKGDVVGLFSLEMSRRQIVNRTLAMRSGITLSKIRTPKMYTDTDWDTLGKVEAELFGDRDRGETGVRMLLDDTPGLTIDEIAAEARRWVYLRGAQALAVDYLQLMRGERGVPREQQISGISRGLKLLAKELDVPIFALAQLNRDVEDRNPPRPIVSDLRESGSQEQDADAIVLLYRPWEYPKHRTPDNRRLTEVIVAKQRQGPTGTARLRWRGEYQVFEPWPPSERKRPPTPQKDPAADQMALPSQPNEGGQ